MASREKRLLRIPEKVGSGVVIPGNFRHDDCNPLAVLLLRRCIMSWKLRGLPVALAVLLLTAFLRPTPGQEKPEAKDLQAVLDKAHDFLKTRQGEDGSFSPKIAGPGISALVAAGLIKTGT